MYLIKKSVRDETCDLKKLCLMFYFTGELRSLVPPALERHVYVHEGIPPEAIELDCPDRNLKFTVLQEFLLLDDRYKARIDDLHHRHALALRFVYQSISYTCT